MPNIKAAAINFVNRLNIPGDWAAICKFYGVIEFYPAVGFSAVKTDLNTYINASFSGSGSAIYQAVTPSIDRAAQGSQDTQRAVIVLSDGEDTASAITLDQVIANAKQQRIPVFTIFYADSEYDCS